MVKQRLSLFGAQSAVLAEVRASGDRIYVDSKPFAIAADTGWTVMTRISYEDADYYLSIRKSQGFNTILADIIPAKSQGNFYRDKPFFNNDMTRPNSFYWQYVGGYASCKRCISLAQLGKSDSRPEALLGYLWIWNLQRYDQARRRRLRY